MTSRLVDTLEWWDVGALRLIQGVVDDSTVGKVDLSLWLLPCESVLLPVLVVTLWVVLTCVSTTGLLSVCCGLGSLDAK